MQSRTFFIGAVTLLLLVSGIFWLALDNFSPPDKPEQIAAVTTAPPVRTTDPSLGPSNPTFTFIGYFDFGCSACGTSLQIMQELSKRYPTGLFVWKDAPFHRDVISEFGTAHIAAQCANEQDMFWEYAPAVFANGATIISTNFSSLASEVGLEKSLFDACMRSSRPGEIVKQSTEEALERKIFGTPRYFINDIFISETKTLNELISIIESL